MAQVLREGRAQSVWERRWRERMAAWRESGLTQKAFCQAHGLSVSSFSHWKSKLAKRDAGRLSPEPSAVEADSEKSRKGVSWTEVTWPARAGSEPVADGWGFEVVLPRGWSIRLGARFESEPLRRLLAILEERSC